MAQLVARLHGMQKVRGSNPLSSTSVMSQDIANSCLASSFMAGVVPFPFSSALSAAALGGAGFAAEWLVVVSWVEGQVADDLAGVGVDDGDV